jgi:hypothetical protein
VSAEVQHARTAVLRVAATDEGGLPSGMGAFVF